MNTTVRVTNNRGIIPHLDRNTRNRGLHHLPTHHNRHHRPTFRDHSTLFGRINNKIRSTNVSITGLLRNGRPHPIINVIGNMKNDLMGKRHANINTEDEYLTHISL